MKKYIYLAIAALGLTSCDSFLEREPLDFGNEDSYYKTADDLKIAANTFYDYLPKSNQGGNGLHKEDINSDNQVSGSFVQDFYQGEKRTVPQGDWYFTRLRAINFFINKTRDNYDKINGSKSLADHYLGEGYFFRAYEYFRLLRNYGDVPILTSMQTDDRPTLAENSRRRPRNEVARFIIANLDTAINLMQEVPSTGEAGRITRDACLALKSRVALYEGTWEKYHANTCFVPGNSKWPGSKMYPDFKWPAGSAEAEYNYFLETAYKAAEEAVANHPLAADSIGYLEMFRNMGTFAENSEVILARYYKIGVVVHSTSYYLKANSVAGGGGGCGVSRACVNTYLMKNGLPIYASGSGYKGDKNAYLELTGRDQRLSGSVRPVGYIRTIKQVDGKNEVDTIYYYKPLFGGSSERSMTGYNLNKWFNENEDLVNYASNYAAVPIFRSGEAMLNYIEAYYERHNTLGGKCDQYWRALRTRAGVDPDYTKTIAATVLSKENDLAVWSKGKEVDKTLYNIRRERRCELIAEGLRRDDLERWRALDMMINYHPEGINLWEEVYEMYKDSEIDATIVTQKNVSKYLHPLQIQSTSVVYNGYTFPKQHYLEPIPISDFLMVGDNLYQNPGWPDRADGIADYNYDCD